ncbi:hypothetical protein K504DRAFT_240934 [Pleomassaria siparia CBS 279.74]|uniref:Uncharacterized protein n=1 Tax=Pleomassaria siparia CBS 279.74 TaxID=1314801 RepID=A0A6G1KEW6_9PLEO|nr:hypothetical protein K504DRAFT_240934 [Pleomassaria siparia CBS 279.74]
MHGAWTFIRPGWSRDRGLAMLCTVQSPYHTGTMQGSQDYLSRLLISSYLMLVGYLSILFFLLAGRVSD